MTAVESLKFGELPAARLQAPDGAQATVTLFGAHLVSWIPAGGKERLFCSTKSALDGTKAIRGGVPVIFPQFSTYGKGPRHGFARLAQWRLKQGGLEGDACFAEFELTSKDPLPHVWQHEFVLTYRIELMGDELVMQLSVRNTGETPLSFATALHSYFSVDELSAMTLEGLRGVPYADDVAPDVVAGTQKEALLSVDGHIDRIYRGVPGDLTMRCGSTGLRMQQRGFTDAVVWNPGPEDAKEIGDLAAGEDRTFICIEAARLDPYELPPGTEWRGKHTWRSMS